MGNNFIRHSASDILKTVYPISHPLTLMICHKFLNKMYIFRFGMASIKYGLELATEIRASVFINNHCKNCNCLLYDILRNYCSRRENPISIPYPNLLNPLSKQSRLLHLLYLIGNCASCPLKSEIMLVN